TAADHLPGLPIVDGLGCPGLMNRLSHARAAFPTRFPSTALPFPVPRLGHAHPTAAKPPSPRHQARPVPSGFPAEYRNRGCPRHRSSQFGVGGTTTVLIGFTLAPAG